MITSIRWIKRQKETKIPDEFINDNENLQEDEKEADNKMIEELEEVEDVPVFSSDFGKLKVKNDIKDMTTLAEEFDEIDIEDEGDLIINPTDNLILVSTAQDEIANLELYIYDESKQNLFIHHDIMLSSYPLCLEWLCLPEGKGKVANFAVVGSFLPEIEVWNLDSINPIEPEMILGDKDAKSDYNKKNKEKMPKDYQYHSDAVLGISLNPFDKKILASGSADTKVIIWDILKETPIINYLDHIDKVQTVKFNKCEDNVLLSGSYDHTIKIYDIREKKSVLNLNVPSSIESVDFSPLNKFRFAVSYENGLIEEYDINNLSKPLVSFKAHKKECTTVVYSPQIPDLFVSCGVDCNVKIWDVSNKQIEPICLAEKFLKKTTGELFCCKFAEDLEHTIAVGGSKGELLIWQLEQCKTFCDRYNLKWIDENLIKLDETNNLARKKLMSNRIRMKKDALPKRVKKKTKNN